MSTTYYQSDTDTSITDTTVQVFSKALLSTTSASATLTASTPAATSAFSTRIAFAALDDAGTATWPASTGTNYTSQIDVTAAGASITYRVDFKRRDSTGATASFNQAQQEAAFTGTGLKTSSLVSGFNVNPAGSTATDRIGIQVRTTNGSMSAAQDITIRVNTVNSYVVVPWTVAAASTSLPIDARDRRVRRNSLLRR